MPIIETKNLIKTYKDQISEVHAVDHVNISISEGEFTAIVGPSGSGKTTLLNLIGGLDTPTSNLFIDGIDISRLKPKEMVDFRLHHIGFVFQSFNLIPVLSAKENVAFVMELQGCRKQEREARALELLEAVGLGTVPRAVLPSCRADSNSVWRWPVLWPPSRSLSWLMSRLRI